VGGSRLEKSQDLAAETINICHFLYKHWTYRIHLLNKNIQSGSGAGNAN
jgi:hypothetical protein